MYPFSCVMNRLAGGSRSTLRRKTLAKDVHYVPRHQSLFYATSCHNISLTVPTATWMGPSHRRRASMWCPLLKSHPTKIRVAVQHAALGLEMPRTSPSYVATRWRSVVRTFATLRPVFARIAPPCESTTAATIEKREVLVRSNAMFLPPRRWLETRRHVLLSTLHGCVWVHSRAPLWRGRPPKRSAQSTGTRVRTGDPHVCVCVCKGAENLQALSFKQSRDFGQMCPMAHARGFRLVLPSQWGPSALLQTQRHGCSPGCCLFDGTELNAEFLHGSRWRAARGMRSSNILISSVPPSQRGRKRHLVTFRRHPITSARPRMGRRMTGNSEMSAKILADAHAR